MSNKVWIKNEQKIVEFTPAMRRLIRKSVNSVLVNEDILEPCEVSVTLVDNDDIAVLNGQFRNKPVETDVLSFPLGENGIYDENPETGAMMLGDIVISLEKALQQAEMYGHSAAREVAFLTVHSMHHLLGYDHENGGEEEKIMRRKEEEVLVKMGLPRTVSIQVSEE
ncbi:MAG: rRNA maturation RNase YbeY [Oscillospiraceae bacterium]|nr:rRNA maturation RNase YbeY [Oscillospiraceae bacterium]